MQIKESIQILMVGLMKGNFYDYVKKGKSSMENQKKLVIMK